jgi:hypothetical protein
MPSSGWTAMCNRLGSVLPSLCGNIAFAGDLNTTTISDARRSIRLPVRR